MAEPHAEVSFAEIVQSDLFTFYVGKQKSLFLAHSQAIAATSEYFFNLIKGTWSEAESRSVEFSDTEPGTFIRFLEYAYRRDYTVPSWTLDEEVSIVVDAEPEHEPVVVEYILPVNASAQQPPSPPPPPPLSPPAIAEPEESWISKLNKGMEKKSKKRKKNKMRLMFSERVYLSEADQPFRELVKDFEPRPNGSAEQDFTKVFLAHAQLYTFADMRLVRPLKQLALHKLHTTLANFSLYQERLGDVLELARYAYEHGEDRSEEGRVDELRRLVVEFIACEPKAFGKHKEFKRLMDEEGEFAGDLWDIVSKELL